MSLDNQLLDLALHTATKSHQLHTLNMVNRAGKKVNVGKCIYNHIEMYNYSNMKQNIDLALRTQQKLDSFSSFFLENIFHTAEIPILQRISQ